MKQRLSSVARRAPFAPTVLILLLPLLSLAADPAEGAKIFRQSCSVGYCHGSGGTAGRAPKLIGRVYQHEFVMKVTRDGIPNTGMPGWKERLKPAELDAVVAYVVRISGGVLPAGAPASAAGAATAVAAVEMSKEAQLGKALFFDAVRGTRCSTCHALEGMGTPAGPNLAAAFYDGKAMREGKPATVRQARTPGGDSFPSLVVEQTDATMKIYDLTLPPPVLRTFVKGQVSFSGGSDWRHAKSVSHYSDAEMGLIEAYLRWAASH
ncbi:MAG: c-type cytochrome [Acidobacteriia bacterium]|nr:c-type cytochrome [Terriglobia bacterium]